jgi:hypothetical protein
LTSRATEHPSTCHTLFDREHPWTTPTSDLALSSSSRASLPGLLDVLQRPEEERAALIGRLYASERGRTAAEILRAYHPDDVVRLRIIATLQKVLAE